MPQHQSWHPVADRTRAVAEARRWAEAACGELGTPCLAESVRVGVSELVTNAVLHGAPPARVRLRGTATHPRVEVADGSPELPRFPGQLGLVPGEHGLTDPEELATIGHGLLVVAGVSSAWGADVLPEGKVVWFTPAGPDGDGAPALDAAPPEPVVRDAGTGQPDPPRPGAYPVTLPGVPPAALLAFRRHYLELRRELWLITVTHREQYPTATEITALFERFDRTRTGPHQLGDETTLTGDPAPQEVSLTAPPETPEVATRMLELLDVADDFCRHHRLLALARSPAQVAFQRWYLTELVRQAEGAGPLPWPGAR